MDHVRFRAEEILESARFGEIAARLMTGEDSNEFGIQVAGRDPTRAPGLTGPRGDPDHLDQTRVVSSLTRGAL